MLITAIINITPKIVVRSSAMMLKRCGPAESFKCWHSLLVRHRKCWSDDLIVICSHYLDIHRLKGGGLLSLCALALHWATRSWRHRELCLQLFGFVSYCHFLRNLIYNELPLLSDSRITVLRGQMLLDHLDDFPEFLHRQRIIAEDCVFAGHFEFIEEVRLHFAPLILIDVTESGRS